MIELVQLQQLIAVSEHGTISSAADSLHLSQPALTRSLQRLETELGVALFDRKRNRATLNRVGVQAVTRAKALLASVNEITEELRVLEARLSTIVIGSCGPAPMWDLAAELGEHYPDRTIASELGENDALIEGRDLRTLLRESTEIVLFAATLGAEVELLLRRAQLRDMAEAVILDACADCAIENVCDNFCADLAQEVAPAHLTDRFSPGYGDLPLAHQRVIFDALNVTRRIGVTLTGSGLMLPQKSVTAILGIAPTPQPRRDDRCAGCSMYDTCTRRKEGNPCEPQ